MQDYKISFLPSAKDELKEIANMHLNLVGPDSAEKITNKLLNSIELLLSNPYMGYKVKNAYMAKQGFRIIICGKYMCFYKISKNLIEIYHITDGRRNYFNKLI